MPPVSSPTDVQGDSCSMWSRRRPLHVYVLSVATPIGERTHAVPNTPRRDTPVRAAGHVIPNVRHNPRDFEP